MRALPTEQSSVRGMRREGCADSTEQHRGMRGKGVGGGRLAA